MSELPKLRAEIDRLDDELLRLLNERAGVSRRIGETKDGQGVYRWQFKGSPEWHVGLLALPSRLVLRERVRVPVSRGYV